MSEGSINNSQQSAASPLSKELLELCRSESLSEEGLRELIQRHGLTQNNNPLSDYKFFLVACHNERVTEGIIQCLIEYFPDAASATNEVGWSPLHYACCNKNLTLNVIRILIEAAPDSVRCVDNDGYMPLHILSVIKKVDEAAAVQILKLLIEKSPESVRHANNDGFLPINNASGWRSPEFCRVLIEAYPGSEQMPTTAAGALPLHSACANNSLATVEYLYNLFPESINLTATNGMYPIHAVISVIQHRENPATAVEIVQFLLNCDPNQKLVQFQGNSLLHVACGKWYNATNIEVGIKMMKILFDAHPEAITSANNKGHMPLHILCNNSKVDEAAAIETLKFLLQKHSEAVSHADNEGFLPIHHAARWRSPEFCRVLIDAYPGSEQITAFNGRLPLHHACLKGSLETVDFLYRQYPEAIDRTTAGGKYPIYLAIAGMTKRKSPSTAVDIVQFLLDCDPNQKQIKIRGKSLLQFACKLPYNDSNVEAGVQIVKILFDARPEAIEGDGIARDIHRYHQRIQIFINNELAYARQVNDDITRNYDTAKDGQNDLSKISSSGGVANPKQDESYTRPLETSSSHQRKRKHKAAPADYLERPIKWGKSPRDETCTQQQFESMLMKPYGPRVNNHGMRKSGNDKRGHTLYFDEVLAGLGLIRCKA